MEWMKVLIKAVFYDTELLASLRLDPVYDLTLCSYCVSGVRAGPLFSISHSEVLI